MWQDMTPEMQALLKDSGAFKAFPAQFKSQLGIETTIISERVVPSVQFQWYTRLSKFSAASGKFVTTLAINFDGKISGFSIRPLQNPAESKYLDYRDKTKYIFPLKGTWVIYQGGRSTADNYHAAFVQQRFAYDIVGLKDGKVF